MLLFAAQILLNLYAATVVTSVAYDAARRVAASDGGTAAMAAAEAAARVMLGRVGASATFDWGGSTADDVVLRVRARAPRVALAPGPVSAFGEVDRTVRLRVERFR